MQASCCCIAIPVIRLLYGLVLLQTGLGSIAYDRISHVLRNPFADLTLLLIAGRRGCRDHGRAITLFVLASHHQDGDRHLVPARCSSQVWETIKKLVHPQGLLIIIYLILLLPLGQLGLTSILTKKVAVPPFVSEELSKSGTGSLLYGAFTLVVFYLNLRLILTLPLLGTTSAGVWRSLRNQLAADPLAVASHRWPPDHPRHTGGVRRSITGAGDSWRPRSPPTGSDPLRHLCWLPSVSVSGRSVSS